MFVVQAFVFSAVLGLVEGVTEFLPISSTGHLILAATWLRIPATEFWKSFDIAIQLGAIAAVVLVYWRQFLQIKKVLSKVLVAFFPTAILGLVFYSLIKKFLLGNYLVVLIALLIGGIAILIFEYFYKQEIATTGSIENITWRQAALIGLFQSLAMVPGVSRSAATIIGGLLLKIKRQTIVEFSFLLAVPTMLAATGLDILKSGFGFSAIEWQSLAIGLVTAFLSALLVITWLLRFIQNHTFKIFGWYRIVLAIVLLIFLIPTLL